MSHIKYVTGKGEPERYFIERENMKRCIVNKCPHLSWGTCLKPRCLLFKKIQS